MEMAIRLVSAYGERLLTDQLLLVGRCALRLLTIQVRTYVLPRAPYRPLVHLPHDVGNAY